MFGVTHGALQFMTYEEMKAFYNRYRMLPYDNKLVSFSLVCSVSTCFSKLVSLFIPMMGFVLIFVIIPIFMGNALIGI